MDQIPDLLKAVGVLFGLPVYLYFIARWLTIAILTSYYETKRNYEK
jgi:hypothetical protein